MQRIRSAKVWMPFALLLVAIALVTYYQLFFHQTVDPAEYPIQRTVKYSFTVKNPSGHPIERSVLQINVPTRLSTFQQLAALKATEPYQIAKDEQGNERMMFIIENLPPYASRRITISASVNLSERANPLDTIQSDAYLADEKLVDLSSPGVQRIASGLQADAPMVTADRIYRWITTNIKKSSYVKDDLGAQYALTEKSGDCTEFMYLFSALARANGIPTRNVAGFVARENRVLRPTDYHNWNEAYIDGEWYLVDTEKQVFMEKSADYIAMRVINNTKPNQPVNSQSFFSASAELQVSMN
jgi:transglutaminase-like putative cysteine protease